MSATPFADAVLPYAQAGWPIVPVPPETKTPPPVGFTGANGVDADPHQLVRWAGTHAASSVAVRMPDGVIGIDVDDYVKGATTKTGAATLAAKVDAWGPLPPTWSSTARGAATPSRIHFYRVPAQRYATVLGPDVEIIQRHHRYAVVWPSIHAGVDAPYQWYDPRGLPCPPPKPSELPELPQRWVDGLREGAAAASDIAAPPEAGEAFWAAVLADDRPACAQLAGAVLDADRLIRASTEGTRHDAAEERAWNLVQLAGDGHPGLGAAFGALSEAWAAATAGEDREDEWRRLFVTAARKAVTRLGRTVPVDRDPCTLTGGLELAVPVQAGPAPSDDRPDAEPPEPIAAPLELHPLEVIGQHPFDPQGQLDQTMAEAVLERTRPVLRYAYDERVWLRRQRVDWEPGSDLAEWAVSQVARLMPRGDPNAEKGSEAHDQAERRKRFMSAGPAGAFAKKMRSLVSGGAHPNALRAADLDSEPWLLWAGGVGWDLAASGDVPTQARIDPATPHMRSAGVAPEPRPTPLWDSFTAAVWPDEELRAWALRVLSIALTAYSDKALPILIGETDRGKTQIVLLLMSVLGNYAHAADPRLLTSADNTHASIVYALKGRRLSFVDEAPRDSKAGQERLKQLTGGGELTGNQMRGNPITFRPTHTLVLTANDNPRLTDPAVRSRVRLIPCEGDPAQVIAARAAIGHPSGPAWRREAPGVLAAMMREAAGWLADPESASILAAPERYRYRVEDIAAEQDVTGNWLTDATEPDENGTRSHELYVAFVDWCRSANVQSHQILSEPKWAKDLDRLGYPAIKRKDANYRALRIRLRGAWAGADGWRVGGGLVEGFEPTPPPAEPKENPGVLTPETPSGGGVEGTHPLYAHTHAHTRAHEVQAGANPQPSTPPPASPAHSAAIAERLIAARDAADPPAEPAKAKRARLTDAEKAARAAERAAAKADAKAAELAERISAAAGPIVELPAVVTADGQVRPIRADGIAELAAALGWDRELTVDVEHTGYPIGHADYVLRTIQLGDERAAVVLDAADPAQLQVARGLLERAAVLHAHSASADLVPLAIAGVIDDIEAAWDRMHDTVIPAKLADPASTGSDPSLKKLAPAVLGAAAVSPAADGARAALFAAAKWLTEVEPTTPVERSGWAQVDPRCETMIRYAAADVIDDAALARRLPAPAPAVLQRERTAQQMTARITHLGVPLRRDHVAAKRAEHRDALAEAGARLRELGVDNPGSDQQIAARAAELGARLPRTPKGRLSVAKDALLPYRNADGTLGELVRARLDYQHHETALGLFLEPYHLIAQHGDGRVRPTVYTLSAATGRASSVRPNLQQLSRQGGVRACIGADPGELIISADFSGVELRTMAALSQDAQLMAMLEAGVDVHYETAKQAYGPEATKEDRYRTKRGVFGKAYGSGIPGIARTLGITESEAAAIAASFDAMAPGLKEFTDRLKQAVQGGLRTFETYSGRVVHLDTRQPHKALNYVTQGTARELLIDALIRWRDTRWGGRVLMPVHDELLVWVPEADAEEATAALVACMQTTLFGMPIVAEASEPSPYWKDAS